MALFKEGLMPHFRDARAPMPNLGRMMVFVDGENLVKRFEAMLEEGRVAGNGVVHKKGVYVWIPATVRVGLHAVSRATYYTYAEGNEEKLRAIREEIKELEFRQYYVPNEPSTGKLRKTLYPIVFKKRKNARSGKGVDIQMTLDILSNVYRNNVDTVYLVSGDGDFKPVIDECIRFGKHVHVAALSSGLNPDLKHWADKFTDLDVMYFGKQAKK